MAEGTDDWILVVITTFWTQEFFAGFLPLQS